MRSIRLLLPPLNFITVHWSVYLDSLSQGQRAQTAPGDVDY